MTATLRGISIDGREASINKDTTEYTVVYKVTTDDKDDGPGVVLGASGLPAIGDLYQAGNDFDPNAVVVSKTPRQLDSPTEWEVDVTASTEVEEDPAETVENPLDKPAELSYGLTHRRILVPGRYATPDAPPTDKDFDAGVLAPNGEPFVPQPEMDIAEPTLVVVLNVASLPAIMAIQNTVNATDFEGAEPRQLRLTATAKRLWHKLVGNYWGMQYTFHYKFDTWDIQIQNQGTFYWDLAGGLPSDPENSSHDTDRKTKDDASGRPLIVNLTSLGKHNTTSTPTYTRLRTYREIDFNNLGII